MIVTSENYHTPPTEDFLFEPSRPHPSPWEFQFWFILSFTHIWFFRPLLFAISSNSPWGGGREMNGYFLKPHFSVVNKGIWRCAMHAYASLEAFLIWDSIVICDHSNSRSCKNYDVILKAFRVFTNYAIRVLVFGNNTLFLIPR